MVEIRRRGPQAKAPDFAGQPVDDDGNPLPHQETAPQQGPAAQADTPKTEKAPGKPIDISTFRNDDKFKHLYEGLKPEDELAKWLDQFLAGLVAAYGVNNINKHILLDKAVVQNFAKRYELIGDIKNLKEGSSVTFADRENDHRFKVSADTIAFEDSNAIFSAQDAYDMVLLASLNRNMVRNGIELQGTPQQKMLLRLAIEHVNQTLPIDQQIRIKEEEPSVKKGFWEKFKNVAMSTNDNAIHPDIQKEWDAFLQSQKEAQEYEQSLTGEPLELLREYMTVQGSDPEAVNLTAEAAQLIVEIQDVDPKTLEKDLIKSPEQVKALLEFLEITGFVSAEENGKREVLIDKETLSPKSFDHAATCFAAACLNGTTIPNLRGEFLQHVRKEREQGNNLNILDSRRRAKDNKALWDSIQNHQGPIPVAA